MNNEELDKLYEAFQKHHPKFIEKFEARMSVQKSLFNRLDHCVCANNGVHEAVEFVNKRIYNTSDGAVVCCRRCVLSWIFDEFDIVKEAIEKLKNL